MQLGDRDIAALLSERDDRVLLYEIDEGHRPFRLSLLRRHDPRVEGLPAAFFVGLEVWVLFLELFELSLLAVASHASEVVGHTSSLLE